MGEEIFVVDRLLDTYVPSYKIKKYDGTPVKGTFYEEELQKVDMGNEDSFFRIEKLLKKKDGKVLVSWKGWPSKYDSWVNEKDFVDFTKKKKKRWQIPCFILHFLATRCCHTSRE